MLYSSDNSFASRRSAFSPKTGVSSTRALSRLRGIMSPTILPSWRRARFKTNIDDAGSGYGPFRVAEPESFWLHWGTISNCCTYDKKFSVPGAGKVPFGGIARKISRNCPTWWPESKKMNRNEKNKRCRNNTFHTAERPHAVWIHIDENSISTSRRPGFRRWQCINSLSRKNIMRCVIGVILYLHFTPDFNNIERQAYVVTTNVSEIVAEGTL